MLAVVCLICVSFVYEIQKHIFMFVTWILQHQDHIKLPRLFTLVFPATNSMRHIKDNVNVCSLELFSYPYSFIC